MTKIHSFHLLLILTLATAIGCTEDNGIKTLGEKEIYFDEKLASISPDGDSACWIGSETGDIWHMGGNGHKGYNIGTDRIYKVVGGSDGHGRRFYWIGIRNSGLQRWAIEGGRPVMLARYDIASKGWQYSVYDIMTDERTVYAATSQGLYAMPDTADTLSLIYPDRHSATAMTGKPLMVNNLCRGRDCILAASHDGMLRIDKSRGGSVTIVHKGTDISCVSVCDDEVFALTDGRLYIDSPDGTPIREVPLDFQARIHRKVGQTHYFIDGSHIIMSEDLKHFVSIQLRRQVPLFCNNIICTGMRDGFTRMVTENALWRIPRHTGVFNTNGEVTAACTDGSAVYYVNSSNELFRQGRNDSAAVKIYDLPEDKSVSSIMAAGNRIYCISNRNRLMSLDVGSSYLRNELTARMRAVYDAPTKITAACVRKTEGGHTAYVGIQDELIAIGSDGRADTIGSLSGKYITAFRAAPGDGSIYLSTLNDGVFYGGNDGSFRLIEGTEATPFIRDIAITGGHSPVLTMLTNHHIILNELHDTTDVKGFNRVLYVNDSLFYALPETGVREYAVVGGRAVMRGEYFKDIRFNPQAAVVLGDRLYLGSDIGVLSLAAGSAEGTRWIHFSSGVPDVRLIFTVAAFIILLILSALYTYKRRNDSRRKMIRLQIDDMRNRLAALSDMAACTDAGSGDDSREVEELAAETGRLDTGSSDISARIASMSEKIMMKNRDMALTLSKHLDSQAERIARYEAYDSDALVRQSRSAAATGNTTCIMNQVKSNEKWLDSMGRLTARLESYRDSTAGTIQIEGVNEGFDKLLARIADGIRHRPLSEMEHDIRQLDEQYRHIMTDEALEAARAYIGKRLELLDGDDGCTDDVEAALASWLTDLMTTMKTKERMTMLRELRPADSRLSQALIRRELATEMTVYSWTRNLVMSENEQRVTKKFDTKLEIEIADRTQAITERIDRLITEFYAHMAETDGTILTGVLKFNNFTNQSARVLALLIANPKAKRLHLPGMLGMFGNMNPVISRLMNGRIKAGREQLENYARENPASMVQYIVRLTE